MQEGPQQSTYRHTHDISAKQCSWDIVVKALPCAWHNVASTWECALAVTILCQVQGSALTTICHERTLPRAKDIMPCAQQY